jgi:hypothetical protein
MPSASRITVVIGAPTDAAPTRSARRHPAIGQARQADRPADLGLAITEGDSATP